MAFLDIKMHKTNKTKFKFKNESTLYINEITEIAFNYCLNSYILL